MKYITFILLALTLFSCAKKITAPAAPPQTVTAPTPPPPAVTQPSSAPEPPKMIMKTESPAEIAGKNIYTTKCAICHEAKPLTDWTVQEWQPIIERMTPKAGLDATAKANLTAYINAHAKS